MITKIKQRLSSKSNKNILTLFSGNVLAQVIPFLFAPWIARIYSPTELGIFAIVFSSITVLATVANARYEMAIVIPKEEKKVFSLIFLCILIASTLCLVSFPFTLLLKEEIAVLIRNPEIRDFLYFIPIIVFLIGVYNPLKYYFTRESRFKILSLSQISKSTSQSIFQVIFGLLKFKEMGLMWGYLISHFFGNGVIIKNFIKDLKTAGTTNRVTPQSIKEVAKEYSDFPKYSVWGIFINNIAQNITIFFISSIYGNENLGYYSFMQRYINAPLFLISVTIGQVYVQELSRNFRTGKSGLPIFFSYIKKLGAISLLIVFFVFFFIKGCVEFFFGSEWDTSADITLLMLPLLFARFIAAPITLTNSVYQRQKLSLLLQSGILCVTIFPIILAKFLNLVLMNFIIVQSLFLGVYYIFLIYVYYRIILNYHKKHG